MKKLFLICLALLIGSAFAFTSCGSSALKSTIEDGQEVATERWVDDNTFQILAGGEPNEKLKGKIARQESAKEAAELNAKSKIIKKFIGSKVEGASGMENFIHSGTAVAEEFGAMFKGGSTKRVTYDKETQACEIIYEVKGKNLKKRVESGDFAQGK